MHRRDSRFPGQPGRAPRRLPGHRPRPVARAAAACLLALPLWLQAQGLPATALPQGLQVVHGQAQVATRGAQMTVHNSAGAILSWNSFHIGAAAGVHFQQVDAASKVLNRVTGSDPSALLGSLTSNGQVWLLNPNGVLFGAGARVDVAGLVASTLRLNDNDFLAGRYRFSALDGDAAGVRNEGALRSSFGGQVVLLGSNVSNAGEIDAPGGSVALAAARRVELVDTGLPNLRVQVELPAGEALNLGALAAAGGRVDVYAGIVNQLGLVQADTLGADAQGRITLHAADTLTLAAGSRTQARGTAPGRLGGAVDLLGAQVALDGNATVDASGDGGGGRIRVGGGLQGQDTSVPNARALWFGPQAVLRADASGAQGDGGRIVLWSDAATRAYGTLSARGGRLGGDGGFIETSGGWLDARPLAIDLSAPGGRAGLWLLDPNDILIRDGLPGDDTNISGGPSFTTTNDSAVITTGTIAAALNAGTSVTVATGAGGGNSQSGDVLFDDANLLVAPVAPVTFTVQAARDIVVYNSVITSTGQPLSVELRSAASGQGAIEILGGSITTAGGDLTLGGAGAPQQLPLPGGGFTAGTYRPAVGYLAGSLFSQTSSGGEVAVAVEGATLNLGGGSFSATGYTTVENRDAVRIGGSTSSTVINAAGIDLVGYASVPELASPLSVDIGVMVLGDATDLTATQSLRIEGAGRAGVVIEQGARLALNAAPATGASFTLRGLSTDAEAVSLFADNVETGAASRGTRLTVSNGTLDITGQPQSLFALGILMSNDGGAPGPLLDLSAATSATISAPGPGYLGIEVRDVDIVLAAGGANVFSSAGLIIMDTVLMTGNGGSLSLWGSGVSLSSTTLTAASALALDFATLGPAPSGVGLTDTTIDTAGGNLRFGAVQTLSSALLGDTSVAAPWVETVLDNLEYSGPSVPAALWLLGSNIDVGSGTVTGGGAARADSVGIAGLTLDGSVINAAEIRLAGRSEDRAGLVVLGGQYSAVRALTLDGLAAQEGGYSGYVGPGTRLSLVDPATTAGSGLLVQGVNLGPGPGLVVQGGDAGSAAETVILADGGALALNGSTAGGGGATAVDLSGTASLPGGLLINGLGATIVDIGATNLGSSGLALSLSHLNLQGPEGGAGAALAITARGGDTSVSPSTVFSGVALSSASPVNVLTDGLRVSASQLSGDAGLALRTRTGSGGPAQAPVAIDASTLSVSDAGAELRIEGSAGDAVRGLDGYASGRGVSISDSTLQADAPGGLIVVNGRGATLGGDGVLVARSALTADVIQLTGAGTLNGNGVVTEGDEVTPATLAARNLSISGNSANSSLAQTHVGVHLRSDTQLLFNGAGTALIQGDTVVLGPSLSGPGFDASGDLGSFTVSATGSLLLNGANLDFSDGGGTAVTLQADSDNSGAGRLRLIDSSVLTNGGAFTGSGAGVYSTDPLGNPLAFNSTVREGVNGVFLEGSNFIDAGAGALGLNGRAAADGRSSIGSNAVGIGVSGTTELRAGSVTLQGHGGDAGIGIDTAGIVTGSALELVAPSIRVTGTGVGTEAVSGNALPGVRIGVGSLWAAASSGSLELTSLASGMALQGLVATAGDIVLEAGGPLTLEGASLSATSTFSATANGPTVNGSLLSLWSSNVTAGGGLTLDATATSPGIALALLSGVSLGAGEVSLSGRAIEGVGLSAQADSGSLVASAGNLSLLGRDASGVHAGVSLAGAWLLQAPVDVALTASSGLVLSPFGSGLQTPVLQAGSRAAIELDVGSGTASLGGASSSLGAAALTSAVAGMAATSEVRLRVPGPGALTVEGALTVPGRLRLKTETLTLQPGALLTALGAGDAIVLEGAASPIGVFTNNAGAGVLSTPNGRWVLDLSSPVDSALGGLAGEFTAYNLAAEPWALDASGNLVTPAPGNAIGYAAAPASLSGELLAGTLNKVYDASASITLDPLAWSLTGLLAGDTLTLSGVNTATMADKNVGTGKAVTLDSGSVFTVTDPNGNPVFGYGLPVFTANVTPAVLLASGVAVADKVYDGNTAAGFVGAGSVAPLGSDVVSLVMGTASFSDKNVGTGKLVSLSGFSLSGADAGNYALQLPIGDLADITPAPLAVTGLVANSRMYDATTVATLSGTATVSALAGDSVLLAGSAAARFSDKNVGMAKPVAVSGYSLTGTDAGNYTLLQPTGLAADITVAPLALQGLTALDKVYDGSTVAALAGTAGIAPLGGDAVTLAGTAVGRFGDKNVGPNKPVGIDGLTLAGIDAANYRLEFPVDLAAGIAPAPLTYVADALTLSVGQPLSGFTGVVVGFLGDDTLAGVTSGTLVFTTPATSASPAGRYAIEGGGLAALNYRFVQAPDNATALTLTGAVTSAPATAANQVAIALALQSVQPPLAMSSPTQGRVLDVTPALSPPGDGPGGSSFRAVNFSLMPRDEVQSLLAARAGYKKKVFATSLSKLEIDPALADVPACRTEAELGTGNCLITEALKKEIETIAARAAARPAKAERRKLRQAALPDIERKRALLIGINQYRDPRVPELGGAIPDARAVRDLLEARLGYETTVLENPTRDGLVRALNQLALQTDANDSVVVYYAGHGEVVPVKGEDVGFWLPSDVNPEDPSTWLSNGDIARMVAAIGSRQLMLISDSCYSGTLVGKERVQLEQRSDAADLLKRRAAVVLSSGGNEPVADEGRNGHSVFAWHLMQALGGLEQWQVGSNVFERVRDAVVKDFPQTPQYGASRTAGHQGNTDYLFERREFEVPIKR